MTEIRVGKTYKIGRARYRVTRIDGGKVYAMCARYLLSYSEERFRRMVERAEAAGKTKIVSRAGSGQRRM